MMYPIIRKIAVFSIIICCAYTSVAQDPGLKSKPSPGKDEAKPFRILTNGQRITIQCNKDISKVIVWTSGGNRYIEQSNIAASSYNFTIPSREKFVFMMLELANGKRYTEKIGAQ